MNIFRAGQDTLIMMTRDFDPILEVPIHPTEFGEGMQVTTPSDQVCSECDTFMYYNILNSIYSYKSIINI